VGEPSAGTGSAGRARFLPFWGAANPGGEHIWSGEALLLFGFLKPGLLATLLGVTMAAPRLGMDIADERATTFRAQKKIPAKI
jgi:hypothetical protein